ncbi:N-acetylmuramoyl-L-alanine amidase [Thalassospira sp.]|uniref:N-acetylmuramoyl-L-alanine amidase n=1 Tax=Thalassospira sp. TaxID=1912094 RepID=UPI0026273953|nr:N-acetylmuramoyl-L-alanine amidase [Thalassospira sp.]MCH2276925.1 N-acetylmuramoyl-L-alanine amidase [Thalassospira sp.]
MSAGNDNLKDRIIARPSPNCGDRPGDAKGDRKVDILVLHYTGMQSGAAALDRLCDPAASVSSHYLVEEDGTIFQLVDEDKRAWHAGRGQWQECNDVNSGSIGIEIVNPGHEFGYRAFPDIQIDAVITLCRDILTRHDIRPDRIIAHSDMAPDRKEDPGELFPWDRLAANGIGLWASAEPTKDDDACTETEFDAMLDRLGYGPNDTLKRRIAFQRHWRPSDISGKLDGECAAILRSLLAKAGR